MRIWKIRAMLPLCIKNALPVVVWVALVPCARLAAQSLILSASNIDGTGVKQILSLGPKVTAVTNLAFSPDGGWIIISLVEEQRPRLFLVRPDGTGVKEVTTAASSPSWGAHFSPDGKKLTFLSQDQEQKTAFYSANTDGTSLTLVKNDVWSAMLTSDGKKIVFVRTEDATGNAIFLCNGDGSDERRLVKGLGYWDPQPSVNPTDPSQIAYTEDVISSDSHSDVNVSLHLYNISSASETNILDNGKNLYLIQKPVFSADGKAILFNAVGSPFSVRGPIRGGNIYTIKADGTQLQEIASGNASIALFDPIASPDGKQIFFLSNTIRH